MARTPGLAPTTPTLQTYAPRPLPSAKPVGNTALPPQVATRNDSFVSTPARVQSAQPPPAADQPAAVPTGTREYYKQRLADFERRNPGMKPPDYYLDYGDKYCQRFSSLTSKDLSPEGLKWRDATLLNLQNAIEAKRIADPVGFAQLERDPEAFKKFAYGTHPDAYIQGGLFDLPLRDMAHIGTTPDLKDLLTPDGIKQVMVCLSKATPKDIGQVAFDTVKDEIGRLHLPHIDLHLPQLPHVHLPF